MRDYEPYFTEDGSVGLYSYADKDVYHSKFGALTEAWEKFILPANINLSEIENLQVLDICYGIGYNTKALMSFILNNSFLRKKIKQKNFRKEYCTETKYTNKANSKRNNNVTIHDNNIKYFCNIDCLELNKDLVYLSPLFKTLKTPEEIFETLIPKILNCFDSYYKFKNLFTDILSKYGYHNRREINELLDLKFKNMHIDKEYKIHKYVNYIIINSLYKTLHKYLDNQNIKKTLLDKKNLTFLNKSMINYIKFNDLTGYKYSKESILSAFLHNIYYSTLSIRDKYIDFKTAQRLFNINFYTEDARNTILTLNKDYDLIFLDAFTYTKAPQLWSIEFISELYNRITNSGLLLTYSTSAQVRKTFLDNSFYVGKIYNEKNNKVIGTIASKDKNMIEHPLDNFEIGLCNTKAGIPYHDPNLSFNNNEILELREYDFKNSNLQSSSQYMKTRSRIPDEK